MWLPYRIVLVETTHPGNLGAVARAMKNMGLRDLFLVNCQCEVDEVAFARAAHASDVLTGAKQVSSLMEAIGDCAWVAGCAASLRDTDQRVYSAREAVKEASSYALAAKVAFVFGRESTGLTNDELLLCGHQLQIPTHPAYPALNLAMAVQIVSYECLIQYQTPVTGGLSDRVISSLTQSQLIHLQEAFCEVAALTGFYDPDRPRSFSKKIASILRGANLNESEVDLLLGLLSSMKQRLKL